jgi:hypothetical protein
MYWFLLKKALPFTLTFVFGAALSGLLGLFGSSGKKQETAVGTRTYEFGSRCRTRRHKLVAESKPLAILDVPDAIWPRGLEAEKKDLKPVSVSVTFGDDGKIKTVTPFYSCFSDEAADRLPSVRDALKRAALMIRFEPETVNGMPVTVTRDVVIRFAAD